MDCKETINQIIQDNIANGLSPLSGIVLVRSEQTINFDIPTLIRFDFDRVQVAEFTFTIGSANPSINVDIQVFKLVDNEIIKTGTINFTDPNTIFNLSFDGSEYVFCITNNMMGEVSGTLVGEFSEFSVTSNIPVFCANGNTLNIQFEEIPPEPEPAKDMIFEIVDGFLPDGLELTYSGLVHGEIKKLDCMGTIQNLPPSQNWFSIDDDVSLPWGNRFRFLTKIYPRDFPENVVYKWFCVEVHNNWNHERDAFSKNISNLTILSEIKKDDQPEKLPETICEPCEPSGEVEPSEEVKEVIGEIYHDDLRACKEVREVRTFEKLPLDLCTLQDTIKDDFSFPGYDFSLGEADILTRVITLPNDLSFYFDSIGKWFTEVDTSTLSLNEKILWSNLLASTIFRRYLIKTSQRTVFEELLYCFENLVPDLDMSEQEVRYVNFIKESYLLRFYVAYILIYMLETDIKNFNGLIETLKDTKCTLCKTINDVYSKGLGDDLINMVARIGNTNLIQRFKKYIRSIEETSYSISREGNLMIVKGSFKEDIDISEKYSVWKEEVLQTLPITIECSNGEGLNLWIS